MKEFIYLIVSTFLVIFMYFCGKKVGQKITEFKNNNLKKF